MCVQSVAIVEIIMDAWLDVEAEIGGECIFGTDGGQCGEQQALVADAFRCIALKAVASPIMGHHLSTDQLFHLYTGRQVTLEMLVLPYLVAYLDRDADVMQGLLLLIIVSGNVCGQVAACQSKEVGV